MSIESRAADAARPSAQELVDALQLQPHVEGGFYRRSYEAQDQPRVSTETGERFSMTSIYYLLTRVAPLGHFHLNRSDIVHYFHLGDPIDYYLLHPGGRLEVVTMGADPRLGHKLQLTVKAGIWKASRLTTDGSPDATTGYGLISEAVSPGFDFADMQLGRTSELLEQFPEHSVVIKELSRD